MSDCNNALEVEGVWKLYTRDAAQAKRGAVHGDDPGPGRFWALRDVSFNVRRGEVVGLIGANGAGKSTLLKIISRITAPTRGVVRVNGSLVSLLEVGTGFHDELSGRDNIKLNATILGMTAEALRGSFNDIVAFSGIESFIDMPVKHLSSGMRVRLGFSIAVHVAPDILIVDEVLAVGDAEFQEKCRRKVEELVQERDRTVLIVSHSMGSIDGLCTRAVRLEDGCVADEGDPSDVIDAYLVATAEKRKTEDAAREVEKQRREADKAERQAQKEAEKSALRAQREAEKAALRQRNAAEEAAKREQAAERELAKRQAAENAALEKQAARMAAAEREAAKAAARERQAAERAELHRRHQEAAADAKREAVTFASTDDGTLPAPRQERHEDERKALMRPIPVGEGVWELHRRIDRGGSGRVLLERLSICDAAGLPRAQLPAGGAVRFVLSYTALPDATGPRPASVSIVITDERNEPIFWLPSSAAYDPNLTLTSRGEVVCNLPQLPLLPGKYGLNIWVQVDGERSDKINRAAEMVVVPSDFFPTGALQSSRNGVVLVQQSWSESDATGPQALTSKSSRAEPIE